MTGGMAAPAVPLGCTGPVSYTGEERLRCDLENLRAAVADASPDDVFVCAVAPSRVGGTYSPRFTLRSCGRNSRRWPREHAAPPPGSGNALLAA